MTDRPTVLIVEDERVLADLYGDWLAGEYDVRTAYDGTTAIEELGPDIDVALLDRRMPDLSGDAVLETIQSENLHCRVAMVTAVEPDFDIIEMGFDDYIVKPVSGSDLLSLVENLLSMDSYDDLVQRYYQLASKKAALEASKSSEELAESEEYASLVDEFEEVKVKSDKELARLGEDNDFVKMF